MIVVSVIIPVFNEFEYLDSCLNSIYAAINADRGYRYEVIISDGLSTDGTFEKLKNLQSVYDFTLLVNKERKQVYALNQMIAICSGEYVVRCDAHSTYPIGYFKGLVEYLYSDSTVGNVGFKGVTVSKGDGFVESLIAKSLGSKFGVGLSHRSNSSVTPVECDTILFGAWRRSIFFEVGYFDVDFVRGQDLEHNIRLRKFGYKVIQMPNLVFNYYGRDSLINLFKMMMQYSSVKVFVFKKHKLFPNLRSFIPLIFFSVIFIAMLIDFGLSLALLVIYFCAAFLFSASIFGFHLISLNKLFALPFVFFIQHFAHACGWLVGLFGLARSRINWNSSR